MAAASPEAAASVAVVGDGAEFGQRRQQRRIDAVRRQRRDEGRLFQFVDGFLDPVDQLFDGRTRVETGRFLARFERDAVRLAFDLAGARRELGLPSAGRPACSAAI